MIQIREGVMNFQKWELFSGSPGRIFLLLQNIVCVHFAHNFQTFQYGYIHHMHK